MTPVPLTVMTVTGLEIDVLTMVTKPLAVPVADGSNCTSNEAVWPGASVAGKAAPERENPAPLKVTELTTTATVPADLSVTVWVAAEFRITFPKEMLVALRPSTVVEAFNCTAKVLESLPELAVRVAVWAEPTAATIAVKLALVASAGTVTETGTVTEGSLLERFTSNPPFAATPLSVTMQASVPDPVIDLAAHVNAPSVAGVLDVASGLNCNAKDLDELPRLAVIVAVCGEVTVATVAVKAAPVAPAGTAKVVGTATEELVLDKLMVAPPLGAGPPRVTVQASEPAPVMDALVHDRPLRGMAPIAPSPLRLTTVVLFVWALLTTVN